METDTVCKLVITLQHNFKGWSIEFVYITTAVLHMSMQYEVDKRLDKAIVPSEQTSPFTFLALLSMPILFAALALVLWINCDHKCSESIFTSGIIFKSFADLYFYKLYI